MPLRCLGFALLPLLLALGPALADTLVLKDGRKLEGEVVEETDAQVKFKTRGVTVSFKKDEVQSLTRGAVPESAKPTAAKVAGAEVPRADRSKPTGNADVDDARKRAAGARERLFKLLGRLSGGAGSAGNIAKEFEKLRAQVDKRRPEIAEAQRRLEQRINALNEWVGRYNTEAAAGRVSEATRRGHAKAESDAKSTRDAVDRLVSQHNRDVERLDKMRENFGSGQEKMEENADELVQAFREADEAWVSLCEAERRAGVVPAEAGVEATSGTAEAAMSAAEATVRWPSVGELTGDRRSWAGRRIAFEARLGSLDGGRRTLQVWVGDETDPKSWSRELTVSLIGPVEAPSGEHAVLEGRVSNGAGNAVEIDRIVTLKK